jgi:hypothetical protein
MSLNTTDRAWVDPGHDKEIARLLKKKWFVEHGYHDSVLVAVNGVVMSVDAGLAEVVYLLWKLGVPTRACCEDSIEERLAEKDTAVCVSADERERRAREPWSVLVFDDLDLLQQFAHLVSSVVCRVDRRRWLFSAWPISDECDLGGAVEFPFAEVPAIVGELRKELRAVEKLAEYRRRFGPLPKEAL